MANTNGSEVDQVYAEIDEAPGADGYWSHAVRPWQIFKRTGSGIKCGGG